MNSMLVEMVDTNILVYAHDESQGYRRRLAVDLLARLWETNTGILSIQVLQEFYVVITAKVPNPLPSEKAKGILETYLAWPIVNPTAKDVIGAAALSKRYEISFWDAMILVMAEVGGASILWSEDLNPGQKYKTVQVRSPFAEIPG
jgi:predicted nucleic acid-binding protein